MDTTLLLIIGMFYAGICMIGELCVGLERREEEDE
jgi:hypothetical protein